jgi:hypothetical protein
MMLLTPVLSSCDGSGALPVSFSPISAAASLPAPSIPVSIRNLSFSFSSSSSSSSASLSSLESLSAQSVPSRSSITPSSGSAFLCPSKNVITSQSPSSLTQPVTPSSVSSLRNHASRVYASFKAGFKWIVTLLALSAISSVCPPSWNPRAATPASLDEILPLSGRSIVTNGVLRMLVENRFCPQCRSRMTLDRFATRQNAIWFHCVCNSCGREEDFQTLPGCTVGTTQQLQSTVQTVFSIIASGQHYAQYKKACHFQGLAAIPESTFYSIQRDYSENMDTVCAADRKDVLLQVCRNVGAKSLLHLAWDFQWSQRQQAFAGAGHLVVMKHQVPASLPRKSLVVWSKTLIKQHFVNVRGVRKAVGNYNGSSKSMESHCMKCCLEEFGRDLKSVQEKLGWLSAIKAIVCMDGDVLLHNLVEENKSASSTGWVQDCVDDLNHNAKNVYKKINEALKSIYFCFRLTECRHLFPVRLYLRVIGYFCAQAFLASTKSSCPNPFSVTCTPVSSMQNHNLLDCQRQVSQLSAIHCELRLCALCGFSAARDLFLNYAQHRVGIHDHCFDTSPCREPNKQWKSPLEFQLLSETSYIGWQQLKRALPLCWDAGKKFVHDLNTSVVENVNGQAVHLASKDTLYLKSYSLRNNMAMTFHNRGYEGGWKLILSALGCDVNHTHAGLKGLEEIDIQNKKSQEKQEQNKEKDKARKLQAAKDEKQRQQESRLQGDVEYGWSKLSHHQQQQILADNSQEGKMVQLQYGVIVTCPECAGLVRVIGSRHTTMEKHKESKTHENGMKKLQKQEEKMQKKEKKAARKEQVDSASPAVEAISASTEAVPQKKKNRKRKKRDSTSASSSKKKNKKPDNPLTACSSASSSDIDAPPSPPSSSASAVEDHITTVAVSRSRRPTRRPATFDDYELQSGVHPEQEQVQEKEEQGEQQEGEEEEAEEKEEPQEAPARKKRKRQEEDDDYEEEFTANEQDPEEVEDNTEALLDIDDIASMQTSASETPSDDEAGAKQEEQNEEEFGEIDEGEENAVTA